MKTTKQKDSLSIINFDLYLNNHINCRKKHGPLLPNSIRCIICGPSNCGKTNLMFNLIFHPKALFFENIYIFSKSINQPKYKFLTRIFSKIPEIGYFIFTENDDVFHPNEVKPNSIIIFDDVACERQNNIRNYFVMGRHNDIDSFYLCQTYSHIPKQLIRDNANFLVLFKQDDTNLRHVYNDHVNTDMKYDKFKEVCSIAWSKSKNSCFIIDKDRPINKGRYRIGFDEFILI